MRPRCPTESSNRKRSVIVRPTRSARRIRVVIRSMIRRRMTSTSPRDRSRRPSACCDPIEPRRVPTSTRRASTLCDSAKSCRPLPRATWGADLAPKGPMAPEDVRFLLVHHTATSNRIPDQCQLIRNIFAFHTSNAKRWNDVAHNYFVGPDGTVWEGRAGSLDGPVAPTPPAATRVSANWCACSATSRRPRRRRQCNTVSSCCSHTSRSATT